MIDTQHITYTYPHQSLPALQDVSLQIPQGEYIAIVGHNGSGKSTLARHCNALLTPTSGRVLVAGLDTSDTAKQRIIREMVGMIFQHPDNQIIATVVEDDVAWALTVRGLPAALIRERVAYAMAAVGIATMGKLAPHQLSGGQRQRLAIAGVLALRPQCIIADEATAQLDPLSRMEIVKLLHQLHQDYGLTIIQVTHFLEEAALAQRVVVMEQGQIVMQGPPAAIFADIEQLRRLKLAIPEPIELAARLRNASLAIPQEALTVEAIVQEVFHHKSKVEIAIAPNNIGTVQPWYSRGVSLPPPCSLASPIITIKNLCHTYSSGPSDPLQKAALIDINLEIAQGSCVAIIGVTGSGKSTLVQHFNGLLRPTTGRIIIDRLDVSTKDADLVALRQHVGMLFQFPEAQLFERTVFADVAFGPRRMKLDKREVRRRVLKALETVGLPHHKYAQRSPFELSGGQMRRIALAGVLAMSPSILVLDEPTVGLDADGRAEFYSYLRRVRQEENVTVVLVSHDMAEVATLADWLFVLHNGHLVMQGTPRNIFTQGDQLRNWGLVAPPLSELLTLLRKHGLAIPAEVFTLNEAFTELCQLQYRGGAGSSLPGSGVSPEIPFSPLAAAGGEQKEQGSNQKVSERESS